ncbi:MAG: chemotaxis protein CheW [candidate division WOR-3 bacterium]
MNYFLYYQIGKIKFATGIEEIKEIVRVRNLIKDTGLPKNIAGFIDLRGSRICIFDLPAFLEIQINSNFEIIITELNQKYVGFKVQKIFGIVNAEQVIPYPHIVKAKDYLKGVVKQDNEILQILSFHTILSGPRLKAIQKFL